MQDCCFETLSAEGTVKAMNRKLTLNNVLNGECITICTGQEGCAENKEGESILW